MTTQDISGSIAISGIGETEYSDGGDHSGNKLVIEAASKAIDDAGLEPSDIDGIVADSHHSMKTIPPGALSEALQLNLEYSSLFEGGGGAANVGSPLLAAQAIQSGSANHVLCYHGTDYASQIERLGAAEGGPYSFHTSQPKKANFEVPFGWVTQPVYMAAIARRHMHEFGTTNEQLGEVASQVRKNATRNEKAIKRKELTVEEYLNTPTIADPFRIYDCCLISDGAGAYVMSSVDDARISPHDVVKVQGVGVGYNNLGESSALSQHRNFTSTPASDSAPKAFEMADISPVDIDFVEVYDCFSIMIPIQLEDMGFVKQGNGGRFIQEEGITVSEGALPVNTHGGLLSQAYLHGINHVIEAVKQLRHSADAQVKGAQTGAVAGWGGRIHSTLVLERGNTNE